MPSRLRNSIGIAAVALACGFLPALGGCASKEVRAAAPAAPMAADAVRPMTTAPDTDASPPPETATVTAPTLPPSSTPATPPVVIPATKPPAPHKPPTEQSAAEADEAAPNHPVAPQISPQLSPGDEATYQRKTGEDISTAENNLQQTEGKQLNAAQVDLTEKIRSFLAQSRDASKDGDWARAQNLAQKARVLSVELINSL